MAHPNSNRVEFTVVPALPEGVEPTREMKATVEAEVEKWKADPTHVPMFPFPVKIVSDKAFPPAPYELPPGNGHGVRIVSNGTPQGTLVMDADGKMFGPIEKLELLPIDSSGKDHVLRCRITVPVSYLDISAAEESPRSLNRVMNLLDHVFASEQIKGSRALTDKLLRTLMSEGFTLWPPAAAERPRCGACGHVHTGVTICMAPLGQDRMGGLACKCHGTPKVHEDVTADIQGCSSCGEAHVGLRKYAFEQPGPKVLEGVYATHWVHCPKTQGLVFLADVPERKGLTPAAPAVGSPPAA